MNDISQIIARARECAAEVDSRSYAELICPIAGLNSQYFIELFPGLSDDDIDILTNSYCGKIPSEYIMFLQCTNGANIMGRLLKIAGMGYPPQKFKGSKTPDPIQYVDSHRTKKTPSTWLFFATYQEHPDKEMVHFCFDCGGVNSTPVYCVEYDGDKILRKWDSFQEWFLSMFTDLEYKYRNNQYEIIDIVPGVYRTIGIA